MQKRFVPDESGVFPEWEEIEFGKLFQRRSEKNGEEFGVDKTISVATMYFKPEGNKADEKSLPKYKVMPAKEVVKKLGELKIDEAAAEEKIMGVMKELGVA